MAFPASADVAVPFNSGYAGFNDANNKAVNVQTFTALGIQRAIFSQVTSGTQFSAVNQGNDVPGTAILIMTDGSVKSVSGNINWRSPSGNTIDTFGFRPSVGQSVTLGTMVVDST